MVKHFNPPQYFISLLAAICSFFPALAQEPDFTKMTPAQVMHWRDSVIKAKLGGVKDLHLPNGEKLDNYTNAYSHPKAIQEKDTVYSTVQFDLKIKKTAQNYTEETNLQGISKHAPQYITANVTEVLANVQPAGVPVHSGPKASFIDYLTRTDNTLTTVASYRYQAHADDCSVNAVGSQLKQAAFYFRFDPVANHFICTISGGIHVTGTQSDKCNISPFGTSTAISTDAPVGSGAFNAIDPLKPVTYAGLADPSGVSNGATISITSYGYKITFDETKQDGDATVTTQLTILIGAHIAQYDAIIESFALNDNAQTHQEPYEKWLPKGPVKTSATGAGNYIAFRVYLLDKKTQQKITSGPGSSFKVNYKLSSSQLPGICTNFPVRAADGSKNSNDLRFDEDYYAQSTITKTVSATEIVSKETLGSVCYAKINAFDYAAYGKLTAHVQTVDESGALVELDAHFLNKEATEINIPMDDNNNHIADSWEDGFRLDSKDPLTDDDKDFDDLNSHHGDGFTLFEEYRGFMISGSYQRLNPNLKELFVINKCDNSINDGLHVFASASNIKIYQLMNDEIDVIDRVVNMNHSEGHGGNQHAILYKFGNVHGDEEGSAEPGNMTNMKPADCYYILINNTTAADPDNSRLPTPRWFTVAHETAHACGVRHHGTRPTDFAKEGVTLATGDKAFDENCRAYPTDSKVFTGRWIDVSQTGTACGGDNDCLMTYHDQLNWVRFKTGDHYEYHLVPHTEEGKKFCLSPEGTGINAAGDSNPGCYKHSYFGNSSTESCYKQIQIKDWE